MRIALAALGVAACLAPVSAAAQEDAAAEAVEQAVAAPSAVGVYDPWESFNRDLYAVHDTVDRAVLEPVARGYRAVIPGPARQGVRNFLQNLGSPVIFVNDVLQAEPSRAGVTAARFGINTTIGILGLFDPASSFGLDRHDEDFGQTLAVWGVGAGPYVFVPVLGPTNVRDGFGRIVDIAFDPLTWAEFDEVDTVRVSRTVVGGVDTREGLLDAVDGVRATSIDPYVTFRQTYGTLRQGQILNGDADIENLPSFDDQYESENFAPEPTPGEEIQQQSGANELSTQDATLAGEGSTPTSSPSLGETS